MCGITGWIDWEKDLTQEQHKLTAMTKTLALRGPDAEGFWLSSHAALGHRRLIVVDPKGGGQPMIRYRNNQPYVLVYNGELYNTPELRRELESRGYDFQGHSDTEVLLNAFLEWGPACVNRLNGIYAFGVWSEADRSLFLARDRMGVKPLFYAQTGKSFMFGSELKTLLAHPDISPKLDQEGLAEIFVLGPARTPGHGVFRGIDELKPGHCLIHDRNGTKIQRYWTLESNLPGMADIDSSLYLFCREIKQKATVALSGECADEIFGGYPWFHSEDHLASGTFPWSRKIQTKMSLFSQSLIELIKPEEYMARRYQETIEEVPVLTGEDPQEARRREMTYLNLNWFMQTLLDRKDRMSMAIGLEVRVPFCDHRIVEYVWNIPWSMKNHQNREKGILRRALRGVLPDDVLYRKKSPYPKTHNPAYLTAVKDWLLQIVNDPSSPLLPLIDVKAVRKMAESNTDAFDKPWFGQLMTGPQLFAFLIQTDTWLKEYKVSIV